MSAMTDKEITYDTIRNTICTPDNTYYSRDSHSLMSKVTGTVAVYPDENGDRMVNWCGVPTPECFAMAKFFGKDATPYRDPSLNRDDTNVSTEAPPLILDDTDIEAPKRRPRRPKSQGGKGYTFDLHGGMQYAKDGQIDRETREYHGTSVPKPWRVRFKRGGEHFSYGYFATEEEAAMVAREKMALSLEELRAEKAGRRGRGAKKYAHPPGVYWDKTHEQYRVRVTRVKGHRLPDGSVVKQKMVINGGYFSRLKDAVAELERIHRGEVRAMKTEDEGRAGLPSTGVNWDGGKSMFRARGRRDDGRGYVHLGYHATYGEAVAAVMAFYQGKVPEADRERYKYLTRVGDQWALRVSINGRQRSFGVHDSLGHALVLRHMVLQYVSRGEEPPSLGEMRLEAGIVTNEARRRQAVALKRANDRTFEEAGYE